jgi:hypothetical protein
MGQLSAAEHEVLKAFHRSLELRFLQRLERAWLFGSRARGEGREDSDLDLLVVVREGTSGERRWVQDEGCDLSQGHSFVIAPLFVRGSDWPNHPLRAVIEREGRPL